MKLVIYIIGESNLGVDHIDIDGQSGTIYRFDWNKATGCYEYAAKANEDAEDIFLTHSLNSMYYFGARAEGGAVEAGPTVARVPAPALERRYYADLETDELLAVCADAGVKVPTTEREDRETILALIDAYWLGVGYKNVHGTPKEKAAEPVAEAAPALPDVESALPDVDLEPAAAPAAKPKRAKPPGLAKAAKQRDVATATA